MAPSWRFSIDVSPLEKSWVSAPEPTLSPPAKVEVDEVASALRKVPAIEPATERRAYGVLVAMPKSEFGVMVRAAVVEVAKVLAEDVAR
jgi:hypothetical protein